MNHYDDILKLHNNYSFLPRFRFSECHIRSRHTMKTVREPIISKKPSLVVKLGASGMCYTDEGKVLKQQENINHE